MLLTARTEAQNRIYAQHTIDTLSSKNFYGRGYIKDGDKKAAFYIAQEFKNLGVKPLKPDNYFYPFSFPVNVFYGKCQVKVDGKSLVPGKDFIVNPGCPPIKKSLNLRWIRSATDYPENTNKTALLYDTSYKHDKKEMAKAGSFELKVNLQKKLTWSVATEKDSKAGIDILKTAFPNNAKKIKVKVQSKVIEHEAYNVLGYVEGTQVKDTFIVLTAHYDHLGMMGNTIFPGANDNASGVAMMLDMANYFVKNPCKYSVAFIAFAGEEAGLIGSKSYTDNAWDELPLGKIRFLINLDLMGSGEKGMAVVNASIFKDYFSKLSTINTEKKYLSGFKVRGKAANSDHYWFVERGVKGFFFYLMGDYNHYHDVNDNSKNLRLGEFYDKSFLLIRDFIVKL